MSADPSIATEVRRELARRDVVPDREACDRVRERAIEQGRRDSRRLRTAAGPEWTALLDGVGPELTQEDVARVLGFGRALTAFFTAPVPVDDGRSTVLEAGATANALVSVFDRCVDGGLDPDAVLSPTGLRLAGLRNRVLDGAYERVASARKRAVYRLVSDYFRTLSTLPFAGRRRTVRRDLYEHIHDMYAAERHDAHGIDDAQTNRTTSVYPFVVIGLPAWFAAPERDESRYDAHLAWLRDVGEFVGLVDDAADVREDRATGAYNEVAARRAVWPDAVVADRIAAQGARVVDRWAELTDDASADPDPRTAFGAVVDSWLGRAEPVEEVHDGD